MDIKVYIASAFTKDNLGGNKAGVVFMDTKLTSKQKMSIARELGFAETAFVTSSSSADYKLEYFTPKEEVDLCGHATIATFTTLDYLGNLTKDTYRIETNSGILDITIHESTILMQQNTPIFDVSLVPESISNSFDLALLEGAYPIQIVSTGLRDIMVPIKSFAALSQLTADFQEIENISATYNVIGMHLFAIEGNRIICRNFAPLYDINEEAATGTSNAALASYLYNHDILRQNDYIFEQGYELNAPSEIKVHLTTDAKHQITRVQVGGTGNFTELRTLTVH